MDLRIENLPRRNWRDIADVEGMTRQLKTPNGTQKLRPIQAASLAEAPKMRGLFLHGRVGCGKTLIAALLPTVFKARSAILVVRAKDLQDTLDAHKQLRIHWKISRALRVVSYEWLSSSKRPAWLREHPCDLLICDEAHKLRNRANSTTARRVSEFLTAYAHVNFCVMSGSLTGDGSVEPYGHLLLRSLRKNAPLPIHPGGIKRIDRAVMGTGSPKILGAESAEEAMEIYAERLRSAPGVIISDDEFTDVSLDIRYHVADAPEETRDVYARLRQFWEAPDGWRFGDDVFQVAACARQLANGFAYMHSPRPPEYFLKARKEWAALCRVAIEARLADSEGHVKDLIIAGKLEGAETLIAWEKARERFPLHTKAEWFAADALQFAIEWVKRTKRGGIVWVLHREVGYALEHLTGLPFYGGDDTRNILEEDGSRCIIASIRANGTSKNLQAFSKGLVLQMPANGIDIEQLLGRLHREGQHEPVEFLIYIACREQRQAVIKARRAAKLTAVPLSPQKMSSAAIPPNSRQDHPAWARAVKIDR